MVDDVGADVVAADALAVTIHQADEPLSTGVAGFPQRQQFKLGAGAGFELVDAGAELLAHVPDAGAGLVVVEERPGLRRGKGAERSEREGETPDAHDQNSPL